MLIYDSIFTHTRYWLKLFFLFSFFELAIQETWKQWQQLYLLEHPVQNVLKYLQVDGGMTGMGQQCS